ncbi:MAG: discoidin domain-containing protein [Polyangiaceae bacterium]
MPLVTWMRAAPNRALRRYLLRDAERAAAARGSGQQADIARYFGAAESRLIAADALASASQSVGAVILYREAIGCFLSAIAKAAGEERTGPNRGPSSVEALDGVLALAPPATIEASARVRKVIAAEDPLSLDALAPEDLSELSGAARETAAWLRAQVDPRSVDALRRARIVRIGIALAIAVAAIYLACTWALAPRNIARGKPTTTSSRLAGSPPASGATNGVIEAGYGIHTDVDAEPWVMVDLGKVRRVREVRVFNRGDGWQNEGVPVILEVSTDSRAWTRVEERTTPYTQAEPWIIKVQVPAVRYLRLRRPTRGVIAISEIEVYP